MPQPRILLVHAEQWLGTARIPSIFAAAGIATTAFTTPTSLLAQSRYVDEVIPAPSARHEFVAALRRLVEERGSSFAFILLADDTAVEAVGAHAGEDWLDRCFPVDHRSGMTALVSSKFAFLEAAQRGGLPLPRSVLAHSTDEAIAAAREIGYPVMIKRSSGSGGNGVRRADDDRAVAAAVAAFGDPVVNVEEFVEGLVGATEALYDRGTHVCSVSIEKRNRYPAPYGPSAVRQVVDVPGLAAMIEGCGRITGFHGFAAICWQYDPQRRRLALLEMNPRPGSGMHLGPEPARIFGGGMRALIEGCSSSYRYSPVPVGTMYHMFPQDVRRVVEQRDLRGALAWIPGLPSARDIPWQEPTLLRAQLRELVYDYLPAVPRSLAALRRRSSSDPIW